MLCTPLSEQVRYLKILDTDSVTHINPSVNKVEAEFVFAVGNGYVYELRGKALTANLGVERRGEDGGEKKVYTVLMCYP